MKSKEEALAKIKELEKALDLKRQEAADASKVMTKTIEDYEARLKALSESNRQLVKGEHLIQTLRELLVPPGAGVPNSGTASDQSVEASLRRILKLDGGEITLERVKRIISVKEEKRPMPTYSTLTPEGKIADLVVNGNLDSQKRLKDIEGMVPLPRIQVWKGIEKLLKDGVLMEKMEDRSHKAYMKHPDVEAEKK